MDNVTIRLLVTISRFKQPCGIERKQSLTSNQQARASCAQAAGRAGAAAPPVLALACVAAPNPPFALAAGGRLMQHPEKHRP